MAWAHVQSTGAWVFNTQSQCAKAYAGNLVAGNLLITFVGWASTGLKDHVIEVTDGTHGPWIPLLDTHAVSAATTGVGCQMFYLPKCVGGVAPTVTAKLLTGGTDDDVLLSIFEYSGNNLVLDSQAGASIVSAAPSVSLTTTRAGALIVGGAYSEGTPTVGASYTARDTAAGNDTTQEITSHAVAAGAVTFDMTQASARIAIAACAFVEHPDLARAGLQRHT